MELNNKITFVLDLAEIQGECYQIAKDHGFHDHDDNDYKIATQIALIGSEVNEALHAHQKRQDILIGEELADVVIRTLDLAETLGIPLGNEILAKIEKNRIRSYKHGDKRY